MPEVDGSTTRYSKTYVTNTIASKIKANTVTAGDTTMFQYRSTSGVTTSPGGGVDTYLFTCVSGEIGVFGFGQSSGQTLANGGVWMYAYLNGTGYIFIISTTAPVSGITPTILFSGADVRGYNVSNLSIYWRKMRIN